MICESHEDNCIVCGLVDRRGTKSVGGYYFAGLLHGCIEPRAVISMCPLHYATWATFLSKWKTEVESLQGVQ